MATTGCDTNFEIKSQFTGLPETYTKNEVHTRICSHLGFIQKAISFGYDFNKVPCELLYIEKKKGKNSLWILKRIKNVR